MIDIIPNYRIYRADDRRKKDENFGKTRGVK